MSSRACWSWTKNKKCSSFTVSAILLVSVSASARPVENQRGWQIINFCVTGMGAAIYKLQLNGQEVHAALLERMDGDDEKNRL